MARVLSAAQRDELARRQTKLGRALTEQEIEDAIAGRPCAGCKEKREKVMKELKASKEASKEVQG